MHATGEEIFHLQKLFSEKIYVGVGTDGNLAICLAKKGCTWMAIFCFIPREWLADNMHPDLESRIKERVKTANRLRSQPLSECLFSEKKQDSAFLSGDMLSAEESHSHTFF